MRDVSTGRGSTRYDDKTVDPDDLPSGEVVDVVNGNGQKDVVDHDEYEEMVDDDDIQYPSSHSDSAMTLAEVLPGYDPND